MRRRCADLVSSWLASAALLAGSFAQAQDTGSIPSSGVSGNTSVRDLQLASDRPYWSGGRSRTFISSTLEAGLVYYRPQLAVGYGKPHWRWLGLETQSRVALGTGALYAGARAVLPNVDLRVGARYAFAAGQSYLVRAPSYTDETIDFDEEPRARYLALETELAGSVPVGRGAFFGLLGAYYFAGVPDRYDLYEQVLHAVVEPPWAGRARVGYVHRLVDDTISLGAAVEVVASPERDAYVLRTGPQLGVNLTHHLDAAVSIMAVVAGPDHLRLDGAEIGQFGFRYRWATGDPFPEFP